MRSARAALFSAALTLALMSAAMAMPACSHINSPSGFVACMENSKDERAAQELIDAMIDHDATAALEAAISAAPDVVRCLLQRAASAKGAGPVESTRARKAQQFLDAHGVSSVFKMGGGVKPAARVGALPHEAPAGTISRSTIPGADDPGTLTIEVERGRFIEVPVDKTTWMTGAVPIGVTDYDDVACARFIVDVVTGKVSVDRRWYCESI